jgi:hypothetical protein
MPVIDTQRQYGMKVCGVKRDGTPGTACAGDYSQEGSNAADSNTSAIGPHLFH